MNGRLIFVVIVQLVFLACKETCAANFYTNMMPGYMYDYIVNKDEETLDRDFLQIINDPLFQEDIKNGTPIDTLIPMAGVYKEYQIAKPFLKELMESSRPPFERYAKMDVNENPVAVLYSQCGLAKEGNDIHVMPLKNFRTLIFLPRQQNLWVNSGSGRSPIV